MIQRTIKKQNPQEKGLVGRMVGNMIRRSVKKRFYSVQYLPPAQPISEPCILVPNHHGWHDGYLMFLLAERLQLPIVDWIAEFDAFPLFRSVGGLPFPANNPARRASTIRQTIRHMQNGEKNLILFAEGVLHRPPEVMPFGKSLELLTRRVPNASVIPVAIRYELSMHERPQAYISVGGPVEKGDQMVVTSRLAVKRLLDELAVKIRFQPQEFQSLHQGTRDVNERWDMRGSQR